MVESSETPTVIVLDASASMLTDDAPGVRFEAAQTAVTSLVEALPESHELGLVVYGTGTGTSDAELEAGCEDVSTLIELGPLDKGEFVSTVGEVAPRGFTPMGRALEAAAAVLPDTGERSIVVVSDGEDHCGQQGFGKEPCEVARSLEGITVHTVGFKTTGNAAATEQLDCMAQETGGLALDAANPAQLEARLPAVLDPEWAASTIQPAGYRGVAPGMTVEEAALAAEAAGEELSEVAASGTVEVVYVDCTLVFTDGVVVRVVPEDEELTTIDNVGVGDDIAVAEELYGVAGEPSRVIEDDTVVYPLDVDAGTGYEVTFTPSSAGEVAGEITKIILCLCLPEPEEIIFDPPLLLTDESDIDQIDGVSDDFKDYLRDELVPELDAEAQEFALDWTGPGEGGWAIYLGGYRAEGYAFGGHGFGSGEAQALWAKVDGEWQLLMTPDIYDCQEVRDLGWPSGLFSASSMPPVDQCVDSSGQVVPYTG
ncbi:MAG: VWA domain-containing protein [Aeromicrobium sp.]|uniref:vWA domain-containing protein n=1 Tax=Aeromicrobium sp. TaxID=1871063 RepID=UPI0039E5DD1A